MRPLFRFIEMLSKKTIQFSLGGAFAVVQQEGDQRLEIQFSNACEGRFTEAVFVYEYRIYHQRIYTGISIFKFALGIALWFSSMICHATILPSFQWITV